MPENISKRIVSFLVVVILAIFGLPKLPVTTAEAQTTSQCIVTIFSRQYDIAALRNSHSGGNIFTCNADMTATYQSRHGTSVNLIQRYLLVVATPTPLPLPTSTPIPTPTPTRIPTPTPTAIPTPTPTAIPTPTPTPTPVLCQVTTTPSSRTLIVGGTSSITASVTSGLGSSSITRMRFGSYDTTKAVAITPDLTAPYSTTVTAIAAGATAVWATADLNDGRICQSTATTDTDITVNAPSPTPTPTAVPTPMPTATPMPTPTLTPMPLPTSTPTPILTPTPTPTSIPLPTPTSTPIPTPTPTRIPTPTTAPIPTLVPTAIPTSTPVPTRVPTPTQTFAKVTIQGRHVDVNGNVLTSNIGQRILLSNGLADITSLGSWSFTGINPGRYTITAKLIPGYAISYKVCRNCSFSTTRYVTGNMVTVDLPRGGNYADIYFKYTPVPARSPNREGERETDDDDHERDEDDEDDFFSNVSRNFRQRFERD